VEILPSQRQTTIREPVVPCPTSARRRCALRHRIGDRCCARTTVASLRRSNHHTAHSQRENHVSITAEPPKRLESRHPAAAGLKSSSPHFSAQLFLPSGTAYQQYIPSTTMVRCPVSHSGCLARANPDPRRRRLNRRSAWRWPLSISWDPV
jgi:hypothetical protein